MSNKTINNNNNNKNNDDNDMQASKQRATINLAEQSIKPQASYYGVVATSCGAYAVHNFGSRNNARHFASTRSRQVRPKSPSRLNFHVVSPLLAHKQHCNYNSHTNFFCEQNSNNNHLSDNSNLSRLANSSNHLCNNSFNNQLLKNKHYLRNSQRICTPRQDCISPQAFLSATSNSSSHFHQHNKNLPFSKSETMANLYQQNNHYNINNNNNHYTNNNYNHNFDDIDAHYKEHSPLLSARNNCDDYYQQIPLITRQLVSDGELQRAHQVQLDSDNPFKPGTLLSWEADLMVRLMTRGYPVKDLPELVRRAKETLENDARYASTRLKLNNRNMKLNNSKLNTQTNKQQINDDNTNNTINDENDVIIENSELAKQCKNKKKAISNQISTNKYATIGAPNRFNNSTMRALKPNNVQATGNQYFDVNSWTRKSTADLTRASQRSSNNVYVNLGRSFSTPKFGTNLAKSNSDIQNIEADSIDKLISAIEDELIEIDKIAFIKPGKDIDDKKHSVNNESSAKSGSKNKNLDKFKTVDKSIFNRSDSSRKEEKSAKQSQSKKSIDDSKSGQKSKLINRKPDKSHEYIDNQGKVSHIKNNKWLRCC